MSSFVVAQMLNGAHKTWVFINPANINYAVNSEDTVKLFFVDSSSIVIAGSFEDLANKAKNTVY